MLPLAAFTKPTIILNTTTPNSGEPLQINCSSTKFDKTASFLYEIQVNSTTVASENSSFVHTIESVNSTESGNYTCKVSSMAVSADIVEVSNEEILSGKSTFLILNFSFMSNMDFFFLFRIVKFLLDLKRANPFQSGVVFHIETIYLKCTANQMAGFYKQCNTKQF